MADVGYPIAELDATGRVSITKPPDTGGAVNCETIAEGIEAREEVDILRDLGVEYGQGFLWGRPA